MSALKSFQPVVLSVLRIVAAYLFLLHGTAKFFSFPMSMGGAPEGLMLVAGVLEIVGGILLILGLFTRPAAFVLSGQMAAAYFMAHASSGNVFVPIGQPWRICRFVLLRVPVSGSSRWRSVGFG